MARPFAVVPQAEAGDVDGCGCCDDSSGDDDGDLLQGGDGAAGSLDQEDHPPGYWSAWRSAPHPTRIFIPKCAHLHARCCVLRPPCPPWPQRRRCVWWHYGRLSMPPPLVPCRAVCRRYLLRGRPLQQTGVLNLLGLTGQPYSLRQLCFMVLIVVLTYVLMHEWRQPYRLPWPCSSPTTSRLHAALVSPLCTPHAEPPSWPGGGHRQHPAAETPRGVGGAFGV